ncbi:uncharacterized protein LOC136033203 isoform X2 [Artemia franciscana]|uniref:Uncharacterized protein n=1 Tax=Artemia franciscana TaxID=6661 RepID=A0AA88LFJ7_ARTSF|nr:hypothetical protein QYM36_001360 [Artemia franciscana]
MATSCENELVVKYSITQLKENKNFGQFRVIGRLVQLSPIMGPAPDFGKWVRIALEDDTGVIIMNLWNEYVTKLIEGDTLSLQLGRIYEVCCPDIMRRDLHRFYDHFGNFFWKGLVEKELVANDNTTIKEKEEILQIPKFEFNFVRIEDILCSGQKGDFVDVQGEVLDQMYKVKYLILDVQDDSNQNIEVKIWKWLGMAEEYEDLTGKTIALKNAEVNHYNEETELMLNVTSGSLVIEPSQLLQQLQEQVQTRKKLGRTGKQSMQGQNKKM